MKYDGDGRATARFFSGKGCRRAPLFTAPADAARHKRCLWSVSRVRWARDGRFYRSRLASVTVYASLSPFSDERPSSRFRGITSPSKRVRQMVYYLVSATDLEQAEAGVLEMGRTWWPSLKREDDRHR